MKVLHEHPYCAMVARAGTLDAACLVHIWGSALSRPPPCTWLPKALLWWCGPPSRGRCCLCTKTCLCTHTVRQVHSTAACANCHAQALQDSSSSPYRQLSSRLGWTPWGCCAALLRFNEMLPEHS